MLAANMLVHNRYRIVRHIATGGMGSVYQATDERFGSTVAIKQMTLTGSTMQRAFTREAKLLNELRHPALPRVTDHFNDPNGYFLVMDFIPGKDLFELLDEQGRPFPVNVVLTWADQLLDALVYLHNESVVHRDIKPQNLKLGHGNQILLLDFGIAKNATSSASMQAFTPQFAPLEQIQGQGTDPRSDLYSLAATIYCLLAGQAPQGSITRFMEISQNQPDPLPPLHHINPQVPPAVSQAIMQGLALRANDRPPDATTMRQMLRQAQQLDGVPFRPTTPLPGQSGAQPHGARPGWLIPVIAAMGFMLVLLTGVIVYMATTSQSDVAVEAQEETAEEVDTGDSSEALPDATAAPDEPDEATPDADSDATSTVEDETATVLVERATSVHATETALVEAQITADAEVESQAQDATAAALQQTEQAVQQTAVALEAAQTAQAMAAINAEQTAQAEDATNAAQTAAVEAAIRVELTAAAVPPPTDPPVRPAEPAFDNSSSGTVMRANKDLNIRDAPGFDSQPLTVLAHGYDIELFGEERSVDGVTWLKGRTLADNVIGWVSNRHIRTIPTMCEAGHFRSVQSTNLNMRAEPGRTQPVVTALSQGTSIELLGNCTEVEPSLWTQVQTSNGTTGWVNSRFLE